VSSLNHQQSRLASDFLNKAGIGRPGFRRRHTKFNESNTSLFGYRPSAPVLPDAQFDQLICFSSVCDFATVIGTYAFATVNRALALSGSPHCVNATPFLRSDGHLCGRLSKTISHYLSVTFRNSSGLRSGRAHGEASQQRLES